MTNTLVWQLQVAAKAPLYFKKAVDDAESEWSQHHAKRWIDTSAKARAALLLLSSAG